MRVAVLGGGLQGACVAMELAARGIAVDLFEARERCLTRASAQNEGKVHLGYVYANDPTLSTARTMVRGGLSFASFLRRWLGDSIDSVPVSRPFNYVVHRASLLSPRQVEAHLLACHELALEEVDGATVDYLGADPRVAPARMGRRELRDLYDPDAVSAAFRTSEVGIDPEALAGLVRDRLNDDPAIRCRLLTHVKGVERNGSGLDVEFENGAGPGRERYDQIVNALWDGRLAVDRTVGLEPPRPWMWRVKHFVRLRAPGAAVPCSTIVLGAFGDVVVYRDRDLFLSWYPAGMRDISTELEPPRWPSASEGGFSGEIRDQILDGLAAIVPAVGSPATPTPCRLREGLSSPGARRTSTILTAGCTSVTRSAPAPARATTRSTRASSPWPLCSLRSRPTGFSGWRERRRGGDARSSGPSRP